jgi:hypothetical protein
MCIIDQFQFGSWPIACEICFWDARLQIRRMFSQPSSKHMLQFETIWENKNNLGTRAYQGQTFWSSSNCSLSNTWRKNMNVIKMIKQIKNRSWIIMRSEIYLKFFDLACGCSNYSIIVHKELQIPEFSVINAIKGQKHANNKQSKCWSVPMNQNRWITITENEEVFTIDRSPSETRASLT